MPKALGSLAERAIAKPQYPSMLSVPAEQRGYRGRGRNKFTEQEREYNIQRTAELYLQGRPYRDIADDLGVSHPTVVEYVRTLEKRWRERADIDFALQRAKELEKLDLLEKTFWQAWERSLIESSKTVLEAQPDRTVQNGAMKATKQRHTKESTVGDPRFLDGVFKCIDRRIKLFGIDAAERYVIERAQGEGDRGNDLETRLSKYDLDGVYGFAVIGAAPTYPVDHGVAEPLDTERPAPETSRILDADYVER